MGTASLNRLNLGLLTLVLLAVALSGCAHNGQVRESSSMSLDKVIESAKDSRIAPDKSPLVFPASVAILMVPGDGQVPETVLYQAAEGLKQQLLENKKYIGSVSIVSTFDVNKKMTLEQVRASYAADVVILIFYHQDQRTMQSGPAALLDAAIVPAFVVPGVKVHTATLIEGVVAHIPSNAVIFRTSGHEDRNSYSTSYSVENVGAAASVDSFNAAMVDFGKSLSNTLDQFDHFDFSTAPSMTALVESSGGSGSAIGGNSEAANDYWRKVNSFKSSGGSFDLGILFFFGVACVVALRRKV
jgi:rhombotail lipoprotein